MAKEDVVWELPVHRSLVKPMYWMGVPRTALVLEIMAGLLGGVVLKTFLVPVVIVCVHFFFRYLGQQDPQFMDVFFRYVRHNKRYF